MDDLKRLNLLVSGRVQGVGYRAFIQRHARDLGLAGTAENLSDGRVEVVLEGPTSELKHALVFVRRGPVHADVQAVETQWAEASGLQGFHVH